MRRSASAMPTVCSMSMARARIWRRREARALRPLHVDHLRLDREDRIERGHRILEDHRDAAAAQAPQLAFRQRQQVPCRRTGSLRRGAKGWPAAAAGSTGRASTCRCRSRRRCRRCGPCRCRARRCGARAPRRARWRRRRSSSRIERSGAHGSTFSFGSIASRSASPKSVKPSVAIVSASPAKTAVQIDWSR